MFPWLWFWSPHFHYPFSGNVAQRIEPDTDWFFAGIPRQAGDGALEHKIFDVASYGRQLGWITEVLLGTQSSDPALQDQAAESLVKLRATHRKIEALKKEHSTALLETAQAALEKLRTTDPDAYERLLAAAPRGAARPLLIPSASKNDDP